MNKTQPVIIFLCLLLLLPTKVNSTEPGQIRTETKALVKNNNEFALTFKFAA